MIRATRRKRQGFTLVELLVSVAVMIVVMGGVSSAMLLAGHAIPDGRSSLDAVVQGYQVTEGIAGELYTAQTFTERTGASVEFTVPDRDADNNPETIRYEWSGTPGDPLTREYNVAEAVTVAEDVHEYQLDYVIRTVSETIVELVEQTSDAELAYFEGWDGVLGEPKDRRLLASEWVSQYFTITVPQGATELTITRATLVLHKDLSGTPPDVTVGIHPVKGDGSYEPEATPVGPTATIPAFALQVDYTWTNAMFSGLTITDLGQTEYCLVVKGTTTVPVWLQYKYAKSAPANGIVQRWTTDSGASWDPRTNELNQQDILFRLYGTYTFEPQEQETTIDRDFLTSIDVTLRVGSDASAQIRTSSQIVNAPEVSGP